MWNYCSQSDDVGGHNLEDGERWRIVRRYFFMQASAKFKCSAFHPESNLLVVGFSNGIFSLYELPEFNMIHTLR